ncbi:MAG TPA: hypothetical protein PLK35_00790 [Candidatus Moranbacteria bacterium]|nr:hypothetical protein [Candidatus Moranbacteria bacterium]
MKKIAIIAIFVFTLGFLGQFCQAGEINYPEIEFLQTAFAREIGNQANFNRQYLEETEKHILDRISRNPDFTDSQYLIYADRNPQEQNVFICFFDAHENKIIFIGGAKTSTGNESRKGDYFKTPTGFFENNPSILGYRAKGTKNSKGWRGLGIRQSRVWDFGWQETTKHSRPSQIRLLMHATDPDQGEPRLGKVDSKGCVRLSNAMASFIDRYGIIDRKYEESSDKSRQTLLLSSRTPVSKAGSFLLVGDSGEFVLAQK